MSQAPVPNMLPVSMPAAHGGKAVEWLFHSLLLGVAVSLGAFLQLTGPAWLRAIFEPLLLNGFAGASALLAALIVSALAHESGHLLAALLLNYRVLGGSAGPFRFDKRHSKIAFHFDRRNWLRFSVAAVPRELQAGWRWRTMLVVAAGPVMTLLLLTGTSASVAARLTHGTGWLAQFASATAEVNFFLFALGLIPNGRFARVRNDAGLFLCLLRNSSDALDMRACHRAIDLSLQGVRPEDYPPELMRELVSLSQRPYTQLSVAKRVREWAIDSGEWQTAQAWDEFALASSAKCGWRERHIALAESACFDLLFRNDRVSARDKLDKVDLRNLFPPTLAERAKAAKLIACGWPATAPRHILRAQYHLPLGNRYYDYERMLLGMLHERTFSGA